MYEGQNIASNGYANQSRLLGTGPSPSGGYSEEKCVAPRDTSAVEQAMNRLAEAIVHAQAQGAELQGRLSPVLVPRPIGEGKASCGQTGTTCAIEERMNIMAENVHTLARQLRETREMLAI